MRIFLADSMKSRNFDYLFSFSPFHFENIEGSSEFKFLELQIYDALRTPDLWYNVAYDSNLNMWKIKYFC